ncbi:glycosyltransferase family 2 protein [Ruminococcaceae bacterium OttesenSCG-928-A16]|nr:glycosyltransferase family 2 protein [Ruminococcaceae bacterium OttesenSCG-928-A16]
MQKTISVVIPCYNEIENVEPIYLAVKQELKASLPQYNYEILFIDNYSTDGTRNKLEELCSKDAKVKAIFNKKNFGQFSSPYYGMMQTSGDCVILMVADFQDPVELIPRFVEEWEKGAQVVCGIKTSSKESGLVYFLRSLYYKSIKKMSTVDQIEHFTGFGLYDKSFIETMRTLKDPLPFLRGIVAEYAPDHVDIAYQQPQRRAGKTHNNWYTLYNAAMLSFTSYTKIGLRAATLLGFVVAAISGIIGLVYLVLKLIYWDRFSAGIAPLSIGVFFFGSIQLIFIGLLGEYVLNINARVINRPLVIEEKRLNFNKNQAATCAEDDNETK